jgi:5-methylthioadenosine/S-adenosylhomocysteine deaminase
MLLIRGGLVLTMESSLPVVEDGAVAVQDTTIVTVGKYADLAEQYPSARVLGSEKDWILPGFVNAHGHGGTISGWFRQGVPDLPLERWLQRLYNTCLTHGQMPVAYLNTLDLCAQLIRSGVTCTADFYYGDGSEPYLGAEHGLQAYREAGMRVAFFPGALDQPAVDNGNLEMFFDLLPDELAARAQAIGPIPFNASQDDYLAGWKRMYQDFNDPARLININIGPDGPVRCSPGFLKAIKETATECGAKIQIHVLETRYQRLYCRQRTGKPLVQYLHELGFLGPEVSFAHGIWVTDKDMDLLADKGVSIVHNPSSNLRLFDGIAPVRDMLARGVNVGLGTDSFGFSDDNDYVEEIRLATLLQRVPGIEGDRLSGQQVLTMATIGSAQSLGVADIVGSLAPGKRADLIVVDSERIHRPFMCPLHEPQEILVHRARRQDVRYVLIDGQVVMDNDRLTTIDAPSVEEALGRWHAEMWAERGDREKSIRDTLRELDPYVIRFFRQYEDGSLKARYGYNAE